MIVLIEKKDGQKKKAFIRNQIFHEVDASNKKIDAITSSTIDGVYWLDAKEGKTMIKWPLKKWLDLAEQQNFWGLE